MGWSEMDGQEGNEMKWTRKWEDGSGCKGIEKIFERKSRDRLSYRLFSKKEKGDWWQLSVCPKTLCGIKIPDSLTLHFLFVELGPRDPMQVWRMASWGHENTGCGWWEVITAASEQRDQLGPQAVCLRTTASGKYQRALFRDPETKRFPTRVSQRIRSKSRSRTRTLPFHLATSATSTPKLPLHPVTC